MGCGLKVPGWTVMRNCASGMQALDSAVNNIRSGRSNLVLAGGVDALSRAPLLFSDAMVVWLANWYAAKSLGQRVNRVGRESVARRERVEAVTVETRKALRDDQHAITYVVRDYWGAEQMQPALLPALPHAQ